MSFRFKIIAGVVAIQTILLVMLSWNGMYTLHTSNEEEFLKRADITARLFASSSRGAVLATDLGTLESAARELLQNPSVVYVRVYGGDQLLVKGGDPRQLELPFEHDHSLDDVEGNVFDEAIDINVAGANYGRVEIGFSVESISRAARQARRRFLALAIVDLMLIAGFAYLLGLAMMRRLEALRKASTHIAQGEFNYQINVKGRDELAQTANAFNAMSSQLKQLDAVRRQSEQEILALNQNLERRVSLRTHELVDANRELEFQALHDALTQLPNRTLFADRLQQAIRASARDHRPFALVALDLDRFKEINDTLGHYAGDVVLKEVSSRARQALKQSDTVARMGGDEFALLLLNVGDRESAALVARRIHQAICRPLTVDGEVLEIGASMGVVLYSEHGENAEELTRHADAAMYEAKRNKSGIVFYHSELEQIDGSPDKLKTELEQAISGEQMILHFQPRIDLVSGKVTGVEALVRWMHPRRGLLHPGAFIQLAEQNGVIKALTLKVLQMALGQSRQWLADGLRLPVAVNVSAIDFQDINFPEAVSRLLHEYQVPPDLLEIETKEAAIMRDPMNAIENIARLNKLGVKTSIDNFGTGYSSLAHLKKLPLAMIKIDKSFVLGMASDSRDDAIVCSTIDLGHRLGLKMVAVGIEDAQAWHRLKALGCDAAQGYFMSKPLPPESFANWYRSCAGQMPAEFATIEFGHTA